mmetsp:Transcript_35164/g.74829  ORF Transcript_35164/g.74829 Transcript_35164/m.74829 type:complete len:380 (+) Transcript_35164:123-1262(+)|eukprot:CAMPEP_0206450514 /NCGR_PEP_ID=MMETSP0324_2-20121206/18771_1 /ASSEMBLY_ACC=CAM_ASM_000836 /TAXON_ID=2866 /ORGANISM="Crypthecodinium cohnii, Strain Seligo" /LENGTH=379 /DNA_ID=CAMNT_0053920179 /DNA_START=71 /DNA_END=1210 /DNA_ORIENTATION=+
MPKRKLNSSKRKGGKRAKGADDFSEDEASSEGDLTAAAVARSVDDELNASRQAMLEGDDDEEALEQDDGDMDSGENDGDEGEEGPEAKARADGSTEPAEPEKPDPYLMADAEYIQKDTRWRNKQRTLVFTSRGVTSRFRYLCEDIRKLLPHHKTEPKFDKTIGYQGINEVAELKSCNNVVFFEARKKTHLYMYVARVPAGPTFKFQVHNIHTSGEIRLAGNCLLGSRPILYFDKPFDERPYLRLMKSLFTQVFGTPRNHPKSKPFHDHVMGFYFLDGKIWFRHYQISPDTPESENDPERQNLTEIGPRFVLEPIRIFGSGFGGQTLWKSGEYLSPTMMRVQQRKMAGSPFLQKKIAEETRRERKMKLVLPEDPTEEAFM